MQSGRQSQMKVTLVQSTIVLITKIIMTLLSEPKGTNWSTLMLSDKRGRMSLSMTLLSDTRNMRMSLTLLSDMRNMWMRMTLLSVMENTRLSMMLKYGPVLTRTKMSEKQTQTQKANFCLVLI